MADPESTLDYPPFTGTTGKRDCLRALWDARNSGALTSGVIFQLANSDCNTWTDLSTLYSPNDTFEAAVS